MSREAMQLALEALEKVTKHFTRTPSTLMDSEARVEAHKAITALRQALETEREWVGLTADEIWKCNKASGSAVEFHICVEHQNVLDYAEAIEAKLNGKNTWEIS